ncbi:MAG: hypothetical protein M1596_02565 [Firmicutes bacterium]|nr:hypothetical protein [Bacillota bacterium]
MGMSDQSQKPEGPQGVSGPDEKVSVSWLILQRLDDLKDQISVVRQDLNQFQQETDHRFDVIDRRFEIIDHRFDVIDRRFETIDHRFETIDRRFDAMDHQFKTIDHQFEAIDRRFDAMDHHFEKMERLWIWTVGLIAVMALGLLAKLLVPGV